MQVVKLIKKDYTNLEALLTRAGLVNGREANPSRLFVSPEDYTKISKSLEKQFKKEYPYLKRTRLSYYVNLHLLNLGPNISNAVRPGFAIIEKE